MLLAEVRGAVWQGCGSGRLSEGGDVCDVTQHVPSSRVCQLAGLGGAWSRGRVDADERGPCMHTHAGRRRLNATWQVDARGGRRRVSDLPAGHALEEHSTRAATAHERPCILDAPPAEPPVHACQPCVIARRAAAMLTAAMAAHVEERVAVMTEGWAFSAWVSQEVIELAWLMMKRGRRVDGSGCSAASGGSAAPTHLRASLYERDAGSGIRKPRPCMRCARLVPPVPMLTVLTPCCHTEAGGVVETVKLHACSCSGAISEVCNVATGDVRSELAGPGVEAHACGCRTKALILAASPESCSFGGGCGDGIVALRAGRRASCSVLCVLGSCLTPLSLSRGTEARPAFRLCADADRRLEFVDGNNPRRRSCLLT